jgi:NAD(P)-dependent dehydrogenase (short-subunit alcohol dehydrogenase family)
MKFYITGSTRGLGNYLCKEFNCISFNRPYDLSKDIDKIVKEIDSESVVILNAHANGTQIEYINKLKDRCRLVICGSIAAVNADTNMPLYSKQKFELEQEITQIALHNKYPILYLRLTSSSYKNYVLVSNTIKFWLDNPKFNFAGFNINE